MQKKAYLIAVLILVFALIAGCSVSAPEAPPQDEPPANGSEQNNGDVDDVDENNGNHGENDCDDPDCDEHQALDPEDDYLAQLDDAASALPEPWLAYPGSGVEIDLYSIGLASNPQWVLLAPGDTTIDEMLAYYAQMATDQEDFETVDTEAGKWTYKGHDVTIKIDGVFEGSKYFQYTFTIAKPENS
ncbi:MAG: hypothetical protein FH749_04560 [Firmicutes bacterium]|nr:hypothetical protein [Bacillota bacterium]